MIGKSFEKMNVTENQPSAANSLPPLRSALTKGKSTRSLGSINFAPEPKGDSSVNEKDPSIATVPSEVTFLKELKETHSSFTSSINSSQYFDTTEGPRNRSSLERQFSVNESEFEDCLTEKKGEQKRSIKKVNPRAEMTFVVHKINLETEQLIEGISNALTEAKKTYLKIIAPLKKTYSNFKWEESTFDPYRLESKVSQKKVRVPVKSPPPHAAPLTEEEKKGLKEILTKTKAQLEKAKALNEEAELIIRENHLANDSELIASTSDAHFHRFPELELDLHELQVLLKEELLG